MSTRSQLEFRRTIGRLGLSLGLVFVGIGASSVRAADRDPVPHNQDRPPNPAKTPEEAIRAMTVPPGFHVEVVASEPDIVNPVAMTFDEKGRVWITESLEYPRHEPGPGRDRVKVLEDTDGDGKADRFTVFADGLNIPSGIAVGGGGVWVANAPDLLFLQDRDGDGKADSREVVVTGFGRTDTHELPNSLTWGPDGWLYGLNGVFNYSEIRYRGRHYKFTCAMFRIHPKTREFQLFAEGTSNPWGIALNHDGEAFLSACVIDHLWHLTETGYYHRQGGPYPPNVWKMESIVDFLHQKRAYCGMHFFDSDAYPPSYREKLYMGNIHGGCINVDGLKPNGATYQGTLEPDFLNANDAWFMPVVQKTGPDGCLYILDWYDRYHCYQDANRDPKGIDRLKGRLYRVRYNNTPRAGRFDLAKETDDQLIERLKSPNIYYRDIAQRLLAERGDAETRPKLKTMVADASTPRKTRMHALWALIGTGSLDPAFHAKLLADADPTVRAWAVRAVGSFPAGDAPERERKAAPDDAGRSPILSRQVDPGIRDAIVKLAGDPDPRVVVQVAIAARKLPDVNAIAVLARTARHPSADRILPHIVWENLHPLLNSGDGEQAFLDRIQDADFAASPNLKAMVPRLAGRISPRGLSKLVGIVAKSDSAGPDLTREVLAAALAKAQGASDQERSALAADSAFIETLRRLAGDDRRGGSAWESQALAAVLGQDWAVAGLSSALAEPRLAPPRRVQALEILAAAGKLSDFAAIARRIAEPDSGNLDQRGLMIAALGRLSDPDAGQALLDVFAKLPPELQPRALEVLTQRTSWGLRLLDAVAAKRIPVEALNLNQIRRLQSSSDPAIVRRSKAIWGLVRTKRAPDRERLIADTRDFLKINRGNREAGAKVFEKACAQCHKIYGTGQDVGPDVTGNGRASYEQLLSNVLDPSLVIGPAYQATVVVVSDGRTLTGLKAEDSPERVVLKLQGGKQETIPRSEIEEIKVSELSLMPEDLQKQLKPQEIADLFEFLIWDRPPGDPQAKKLPGAP